LNYAIGVFGRPLKFNKKKWNPVGGDNEKIQLILKLAELNPDDNFYIISNNDINTLNFESFDDENNIPKNIINCFSSIKRGQLSKKIYDDFIVDYFKSNNIKIDKAIIFSGPQSSSNLDWYSKRMEFIKYNSSYIFKFLNESMVPWDFIFNDPRNNFECRDLYNLPKRILGQYNFEFNFKFKNPQKSNIEPFETKLKSEYTGIEKIFLLDAKISDNIKTDNKLKIVLNEGTPSRYSELKKYVLDYIDDVEIYGKWKDYNDERFKGTRTFDEIKEIFNDTKYTFIIPIAKGWVTSKYIEMISYGIIPFFHPDYDTQKHLKVPDFIRVSSPDELHRKIELLEHDIDLYNHILDECKSLITEDDISGVTLNNLIIKNLNY
jgi:hypothetical protein